MQRGSQPARSIPDRACRSSARHASTAQIDGDNGPGQWVSMVAMGVAMRKACEQGVGIVSVRGSNHFGAAGHYVWEAAKNGLIGLCTTNGPLVLAPTGGVTPTFGNNPLAVGIPAGRHFPILLDIAMSVAPRGRIGLAMAEGKPLLPGWILDRFGQPSTDLADLAAGLGVPIGGHKGYGLALVLEVLAGVLSGAGFAADHRPEKLHLSSACARLRPFVHCHRPGAVHAGVVIRRARRPADRGDKAGRARGECGRDPDPRRKRAQGPRAEPERRRPSQTLDLSRARRLRTEEAARDAIGRRLDIDSAAGMTERCHDLAAESVSKIPFGRSELEESIVARFDKVAERYPLQIAAKRQQRGVDLRGA